MIFLVRQSASYDNSRLGLVCLPLALHKGKCSDAHFVFMLAIDMLKSLLADKLAWHLCCGNNKTIPPAHMLVQQFCY